MILLFKNAVILITCVIKDSDKSYLQLFSEEKVVSQNCWEVVKVV